MNSWTCRISDGSCPVTGLTGPGTGRVPTSFQKHNAAIRLDSQTGKQEVMEIGVPQGSTVAPILFMLFTALLLQLFHGRNKQPGLTIRGYVDDKLLTARAQKEELVAKMIESAFAKIEKWAEENGMIFDPNKFEAIHFPRKKTFPNPDIKLPPLVSPRHNMPERVVRLVRKKSSMRWLGVFYDSRLSFRDYANKLASKGRQAASGLKMLVKTAQGVNVAIMHRVVHVCIFPILIYPASAWWHGRTRTNKEGQTIQNSKEGLRTKLDKVQNIALRSVLPV